MTTPARPPRSRVRRIARGTGFVLVTMGALVGLLLGFLQTPWGREVVRARVEAGLGARVNGTVTVGAVSYGWLFRDVELRGLAITDTTGRPALAIEAVRVTLDRRSLLARGAPVIEDLVVAGLDVTTARLAGLAKPGRGGAPLTSLTIERLRLDGAATIEKPDGTVVRVRDLAVAGRVVARPAAQELELALRDLTATATLARPGHAPRELAVAIAAIAVSKRATGADLELGPVTAGAVSITRVGAHLALADRRLVGTQAITLAGLRVENNQLAALLGRDLLRDDATLDVSITGPVARLVVDGDIHSGPSHLALDGTVDLSNLAVPAYDLVVTGDALRSDVVTLPERPLPPVATSLRARVVGSGVARGGIAAKVSVEVGPTTIGELVVDGVTLEATADHGALRLDRLHARGPGLDFDGAGLFGADRVLDGRITVHATPPALVATLAKYGIVVPPRAPLPPTLDVEVIARGRLDGTLAVDIQPTQLALAGGRVAIAGRASLENRRLATATIEVGLRGLDLRALARSAGRRPTVAGSLSGALTLIKAGTDRRARYDLAIALPALGLAVVVRGDAQPHRLVARVSAARARDRSVLATLVAELPLTKRAGRLGLDPARALAVQLDVARRSLDDLAALVPARLRARLPASGDVELHGVLGGTAARPTGHLELAARATAVHGETQRVALRADLHTSAGRLVVATRGSAWLRDEAAPIATLDGQVTTVLPFARGTLDARALRAGATVDATLVLPPREIAALAWLRPALANVPGAVDGRVAITGPLAAPRLAAALTLHDLPTADGRTHDVGLTAEGTPTVLTATLTHGDAVTVTAHVDRSVPGRIALDARMAAAQVPLRTLIPAALAARLGPHVPGLLDADLTARGALVRGPHGLTLDTLAVAGTLDVRGGEILVPTTTRRWRDIQLSLAAEPTGLRLVTLELHERDRQVADRRIRGTGFVRWDRFKPQHVTLALTTHDWLLSGTPGLGPHDAPRATLDADLALEVDLRAPVLAIDATINALALRMPPRFDRAHQYENAALGGDILYTDGGVGVGRLPVTAPVVPPAARPRRALDVRLHIPRPIRVQQPPLDIEAEGDIAVQVRDTGVTARGALTIGDGVIELLGHRYRLVQGGFALTDAHPRGWLDVTFEHALPPAVARTLSRPSAGGGARITLQGPPTKPVPMLGGANNAALVEAMALNTTGYPSFTSAPDLPAATTVNLARTEALQVLSFMAANLPRLLVLDRLTAYADATRDRAAYGRIQNVEAERYARDQRTRVRAVVRPPTPGRSSAELQVDRLLINDDHTAVGVGVRAGDRGGGGVGVFVEWSSD